MAAAIEILKDSVIPEIDAEIVFGSETTIDEHDVKLPVYIQTCSYCGTQEINSKIPNKTDYMCVTCNSYDVEEIYKGNHETFEGSLCLQGLFLTKRLRCKNKDCLTKNVVRYTEKGLKMNGEVCKYNSIKTEFPNALDSQGKQLGSCTRKDCRFSHEDIKGLYMLVILPDVCKFGEIENQIEREPERINLYKRSCYKPLAYKDGCDDDDCYREHDVLKLLDNIKKPHEKIAFQKFLDKGKRMMLNFDDEGNFISDPNIVKFKRFLKTVVVNN
jgi:hypothetical protein